MLKDTAFAGKRYRPNSFRLRLAGRSQLEREAPQLARELRPIAEAWRAGHLTEAEAAALYLVKYLRQRHADRWLVGPAQPIVLGALSQPDTLARHFGALGARENRLLGIQPHLFRTFNEFTLRGVPLRARQGLCHWLTGEWKLRLMETIPSPEQLLTWQCAGERVVTALFSERELADYVEDERDALGFILHDLIHAAQFFAQPELREGQLGFYRMIHASFTAGLFTDALTDARFADDFAYLISDMNSHSVHLVLYLLTSMRNHFRRRLDLPIHARLAHPDEQSFKAWFEQVLRSWNMPRAALEATLRLTDNAKDRALAGAMVQEFFAARSRARQ